MLWVDAAGVTTQVVQLKTGWDGTAQALIVKTVGILHPATLSEVTVPTTCN